MNIRETHLEASPMRYNVPKEQLKAMHVFTGYTGYTLSIICSYFTDVHVRQFRVWDNNNIRPYQFDFLFLGQIGPELETDPGGRHEKKKTIN